MERTHASPRTENADRNFQKVLLKKSKEVVFCFVLFFANTTKEHLLLFKPLRSSCTCSAL